jgi:acyl-CoA reductase-like NAD-dependent aldehyde dehydrogenase
VTDCRWRNRTERPQLLLACADVLEDHATELTDLLSLENGTPVTDARENDIRFLTGVFRFFGSIVDKLPSGDFHDSVSIYSATGTTRRNVVRRARVPRPHCDDGFCS